MFRRSTVVVLAALLAAVFGFQLPAAPAGDAKPFDTAASTPDPSPQTLDLLRGKVLALDAYGPSKNTGASPDHPIFNGKIYALGTGELVGTVVDDVQCITPHGLPCNVVDVHTTFNLPEGTVVNHMLVGVDPDPQRPGYVLTGARPDGNTIESATGIYAGRTGHTRLSGLVNLGTMPAAGGFDDFFIIQFD
jgi:hypothetical protein